MKISAINTNFQQVYKSNNTAMNNSSKPSFGFGIDYGDDDFLVVNNYEYKEGSGSVFEYFRLLGELVCTLYKERFGSGNFTCSDNSIFNNTQKPIVTYITPSIDNEVSDCENIDPRNIEPEDNGTTTINYLDFMDDDEWY